MAVTGDGLISDLDKKGQKGLLIISRGTAILLLGVYVAYLIFQLKTHAELFVPKRRQNTLGDEAARSLVEDIVEGGETPQMSVAAAGVG